MCKYHTLKDIDMTILDNIKRDRIEARKLKNTAVVTLLSTLVAEIEAKGKATNREATDDESGKTIKKFIENAEEVSKVKPSEEVDREIALYKTYMPAPKAQLTVEELTSVIREIIAAGKAASVRDVMTALKDQYSGQYDGGAASSVAKAELTAKS